MPTGDRPSPVARATALARRAADRWQATRVARALARVGRAAGGVLAGGVAYAVLFALAAILTLGFTALSAVLGGQSELRDQIIAVVDENLPGLIDGGDGGLLNPDDLVLTGLGTLTGVVAAAVLLWSATAAAAAMRTAVRAVAGAEGANAAVGKLREVAGLLALALAVLVASVAGLALSTLTGTLVGALGWSGGVAVVATRTAGVLAAGLLDVAVFVLVVRVLAGLRPARRDLWAAAGLTAVAVGVLRHLGAAVVAGSAATNPLFASVAVLATLLVWLNLLARVHLTTIAWMVEGEPPAESDGADGADPVAGGAGSSGSA